MTILKALLILSLCACGRMQIGGEYEGGLYWSEDHAVPLACTYNGINAVGHYSIQQSSDGKLTGSYHLCSVEMDDLHGFASFDYFNLLLLGDTVFLPEGHEVNGQLEGKLLGVDSAVLILTRVK